jgi:hypothetical protein
MENTTECKAATDVDACLHCPSKRKHEAPSGNNEIGSGVGGLRPCRGPVTPRHAAKNRNAVRQIAHEVALNYIPLCSQSAASSNLFYGCNS